MRNKNERVCEKRVDTDDAPVIRPVTEAGARSRASPATVPLTCVAFMKSVKTNIMLVKTAVTIDVTDKNHHSLTLC